MDPMDEGELEHTSPDGPPSVEYKVLVEVFLDKREDPILVKFATPQDAFNSPYIPERSRVWVSRVSFIGNSALNQFKKYLDKLPSPREGTDDTWPTVRKGALYDLLLSEALTPEQAAQTLGVRDKENYKMARKKKEAAAEGGATESTTESTTTTPARSYGRLDKDAKIKILADKNPKREGSAAHARFALYKTGMKVETFIKNGGTAIDVAYDVKKGYIQLVGGAAPDAAGPAPDAGGNAAAEPAASEENQDAAA